MVEVMLNGTAWFVDAKSQIVYEDNSRKKGMPISYLSNVDQEIIKKAIRFPKSKKTVEEF